MPGQGVTQQQISVATTIINIAGAVGNGAVGVPDPTTQQQYWQTVANSINAKGGVACRKLAMSYYQINPVDASGAQQQCLAIANANPLIALDTGGLTAIGASDCIPQQKVPLVAGFVTGAQVKTYYPYYIAPGDLIENGYRNGILGLNQYGYFSSAKGFKKLGIVYFDCTPAYYNTLRSALTEAHVSSGNIDAFDFGCTSGQESAADDEQAVLQFKNDGVTDVTEAGTVALSSFTKVAQQQGFHPQYILADPESANENPTGASAPDPTNFNGAVDVTPLRAGEQNTPGLTPGPGTQQCDAIFAAAGMPSVEKQADSYGGVICAYLFFVAALLGNAPSLQHAQLVAGMAKIGAIDEALPYGPVDFSKAPSGAAYGIAPWRADQWSNACSCWKVLDPTFHPAFS